MNHEKPYPVGSPGVPWGEAEKARWLALQSIKRSYADEVLATLESLDSRFEIVQYGALSRDPERYPLFAVRSGDWRDDRATVLVTGGVHGYETSGVQGALRFLTARAHEFAGRYNIVVAPCLSPWGYETINRWNAAAIDPNRSFRSNSPCEESSALMKFLEPMQLNVALHMDLHETTDTDNSQFRPALAARDAKTQAVWDIPDGFYTVGDTQRPEPDFQKAIIDAVSRVTHIAPADDNGSLIGVQVQQKGVILYEAARLGLCMGLTDARFVSTTEMYPDSPRVDDENCIQAQVAAVEGAINFVICQER